LCRVLGSGRGTLRSFFFFFFYRTSFYSYLGCFALPTYDPLIVLAIPDVYGDLCLPTLWYVLPLFSAPSFPFTYPSLLAFQLSIRGRFTQLTSLALLEPLDFRPFGFSPIFSLLMSTFLLLIATLSLSPISLPALQNTLLPTLDFSSNIQTLRSPS